MALTIKQIHPVFVGEVSGVDLTKPLGREDAAAIEAGMNRYAVLVFRGQNVTDAQQIAFTRNFGELEVKTRPGHIRKARRAAWARASPISPTSTRTATSCRPRTGSGSSSSATGSGIPTAPSARCPRSIRCSPGRVVPSWGGNTEFADMRAAYDALDERTKAEVEDLVCEHSLIYSREAIGFTDLTPEEIANVPAGAPAPRAHHPVTGRKSLFLSAHAGAIDGWTVPEARMFLRDLTEHATQREFVYSHAWRPGDLVMWDNRATMHRARRFDRNEVRDVRRTTLAGDAPTIEQLAA